MRSALLVVLLSGAAAAAPAGRALSGHKAFVLAVAFSPDGKLLASAGADRVVRLWDAATGAAGAVLSGHNDKVLTAAFSADGKSVVASGADGATLVWDLAQPAQPRALDLEKAALRLLVFSPTGEWLLSARDSAAQLRDSRSGELKAALAGHAGRVLAAAFSPDGKGVATASDGGTVRFWELPSGAAKADLAGKFGAVLALSWSAGGRLLAAGAPDNSVRVWDLDAGRVKTALTGPPAPAKCAAFSPDGLLLAAGGFDNRVRVWNVSSAAPMAVLEGHSDVVEAVAFSPDGKLLASAGLDKTVWLWDLEAAPAVEVSSAAAPAAPAQAAAQAPLEPAPAAPRRGGPDPRVLGLAAGAIAAVLFLALRRRRGASGGSLPQALPLGGVVAPLTERFELLGPAVSGPAGQCHEARERNTGRRVALERIDPEAGYNLEDRKAFVAAARAAMGLRHPAIAAVTEVIDQGEELGVVREWAAGESLAQLKAQGQKEPPPAELSALLKALGEALAYAHGRGVAHLGLTPSCVLVAAGAVKITGFSYLWAAQAALARRQRRPPPASVYTAPELLTGRGEARADLYSLGAIAHELLYGRPPGGEPPAAAPAGVPKALAQAVERCLSTDPKNRFASAAEFLKAAGLS